MYRRLSVLSLLVLPIAAVGQSPAGAGRSVERAVSSILPADIARRIGIIAHDSMRGRDTPSPELDEVAQYIAGEFRRFGLRPGGDDGSYLQRYGIVRKALDPQATKIAITGPASVTLTAGNDAHVVRVGLPLPDAPRSGPIVLVTGPFDAQSPLGGADVRGAWVAQVARATPEGVPLDRSTAQAAVVGGALGVLLITDRPDTMWASRMRRQTEAEEVLEGGAPPADVPAFVEIRDATAARVFGIDPPALARETARRAVPLEGFTLSVDLAERVESRVTAPNVIGVLEGSDPRLKNEYVVLTAHMDHVGVGRPVNGDSIYNGADDDASGTIAVVEAAEAFALLQPRPRRSLVFMTVSGEEKGLWGSAYFSEHPTVPLANVVANLNLDMVGRNWTDTIAVIGKEHSDLGATLERVAGAHPELRMTPIDDIWPQENFYFRSDHYNFARKGVPILFFFNGVHPDYHRPSDHPDKIDAEKESRIVKLVFYLGLEIANAAERPKWDPDSYQRIVTTEN